MNSTKSKLCQANIDNYDEIPEIQAASNTDLAPDLDQAHQFVKMLGDGCQYYRAFHDKKERPEVFYPAGEFDDVKNELTRLNQQGFGIFIVVNGKGAHKVSKGSTIADEDITKILALFMDLDGPPVEPILETGFKPHAIIESSPGKHHIYGLVANFPLGDFKSYQEEFVRLFKNDRSVTNPSRIMRLPGFYHQKKEPFLVRMVDFRPDLPRYSPGEIIHQLGLDEGNIRTENDKPTRKDKNTFVLPNVILKGARLGTEGRDKTLWRYLCKLWAEGKSKEELLKLGHAANQERCKPPLKESIIDEKVERICRLYKQGTKKEPSSASLKNGKKFNPSAWIRALRNKYHLLYHNKRFYYFNVGYYKPLDENQVNVLIESLDGPDLRKHNFQEIQYKLKIKLSADQQDKEIDDQWILNLNNGWIDLRDVTYSLRPHTPALLTTFKNNINYNPQATCEKFVNFLERQFPDLLLRDLIWEMIGYLLIPSTKFQVGFFFWGPTETGKSKLLEIIQALLGGEHRCSVIPLENFGDRFSLSEIEGKLVNIVDETNFKASISDKPVKQVISGVTIAVEKKNEQPRSIRPIARVIVASNDFPRTADTTDAFFRRWIVIPATVPRPDPPDHDLAINIIKTELEGILTKAVGGLKRLLKNRKFTQPESCEKMKAKWREKVNLVEYWANRCLIPTSGTDVKWADLSIACNDFLAEEQLKTVFSRRDFNQRMKDLGYRASISHGYPILRDYSLLGEREVSDYTQTVTRQPSGFIRKKHYR